MILNPLSSSIQTIHRRISIRSYLRRLLDDEQELVRRALASLPRPPFGSAVHIELIDGDAIDRTVIKKLGTYGFVQGTSQYLVGAVRSGERALMDFGYCFEKAVLDATALGFGTCWMALTFKRDEFGRAVRLQKNEIMPAISPIGVPLSKRSLFEKFLHLVAKSRKRKPWKELFFSGSPDTPLSMEAAGPYAKALECVRLAPSGVNMQPWRIVKDPDRSVYHFYTQMAGPESSGQLHAGIAMCHFAFAAQELGLAGSWTLHAQAPEFDGLRHAVTWVG
jgi:nitroreductase